MEDVPALLAKRWQIINLWRPINHAALDWPLALCDYRTVDRADLAEIRLRYVARGFNGQTYGVRWREGQRWVYVRGLTPEEGVLIKW